MSTLTIEPLSVPLRQDESGAIRVGKTRVLLELVVREFRRGATPEAIVQAYDTLDLRDVYAVLAYCLAHESDIDEYLRQCDQDAEAVRREIEATQPRDPNLREKLLARAKARGRDRAAPVG
jgi:uncharacterized protein (DUF433 family)